VARVRNFEARERVMPQNPEIEQAVLGAVMLSPDKLPAVLEIIKPESFYLDQHRFIFQAFIDLYQRGLKPDLPAVIDELKQRDLIERVGGAGFAASLLSAVPTAAHVEHHAELVAEKHVLRSLIQVCTQIVDVTYSQEMHPEQLMDWAEQAVLDVTKFGRSADYAVFGDVLTKLFEQVVRVDEYRKEHPGEEYFPGEPTGFPEIDKLTRGFHAGSLNILAARPGVGKTSLALNMALHIAAQNKKRLPVLVFSLEMPNFMLATRMLSSESRIPIGRIESAELDDEGWQRLTHAVRRISDVNVFMNDSSSISVRQIGSTARRVVSRLGGVALIVADYLQLMRTDGRHENRVQEVSSLSRGLKALALDLRVPILACSQLSRQVVQRKDQKPVLSDLRESGSIEQDADVVMFLSHHSSTSDKDGTPANSPGYAEKVRRMKGNPNDKIWCSIAKNRNGPVGECPLLFLREFCKFVPGDWSDFVRSGGRKKARGAKE